jgi:hypothetical protein
LVAISEKNRLNNPKVGRVGVGGLAGAMVEGSRQSGLGADEIVDGWFDAVAGWGCSLDFLHSLEHCRSFEGLSC